MIGLSLGLWGNRPAAGGGGVPGTYVRVRFPSMIGAAAATVRNVGAVAGQFSLMNAAALAGVKANPDVAITFPLTVAAITMASGRGPNVITQPVLTSGWNTYNATISTTTEPVAPGTPGTYAARLYIWYNSDNAGDANPGAASIAYTSDGFAFGSSKSWRYSCWAKSATGTSGKFRLKAYYTLSGGGSLRMFSPDFDYDTTWQFYSFDFVSPSDVNFSNLQIINGINGPTDTDIFVSGLYLEDIT